MAMRELTEIFDPSSIRRAIGDIFQEQPIDRETITAPWVGAVMGVLLGIMIVTCIVTAILVFSRRSARRRSSRLDATTYHCTVNASEDTVKVLTYGHSSAVSENGYFNFTIREFASIFTPASTVEIMAWFRRLSRQTDKVQLLDVTISSEGLKKLFGEDDLPHSRQAQLMWTGSDSVTGSSFVDLIICPNLSAALSAKPLPRYLSYRDYLRNLRWVLRRERSVQFIHISLNYNLESGLYERNDEAVGVLISRLAEYLSRMLLRNTYLVRVSPTSLMWVDVRPASAEVREKRVTDLAKDVLYFLKINNIEEQYTPLVGSSFYEGDVLQPLGYYPQASERDARDRLARIAVGGEGISSFEPAARREVIRRAIDDRTVRLYFTPCFMLSTGEPAMYSVSLEPYISTGSIDSESFAAEVHRFGLTDRYLDCIADLASARLPKDKRVSLLIHAHIGSADALIRSGFNRRLKNADIWAVFSHSEIERFSGDKLREMIASINAAGIKTALSLENKPPIIDDSTLSLFSLFILGEHTEERQTADLTERIDTLSAIGYLKSYGKPIAMFGLSADEETYFALIHGISYVTSSGLGKPSSWIEGVDSEAMAVIEMLHTRQYVRR